MDTSDIKSYVYVITNLITKKIYIGKANNPDRRWEEHKRHAKTKLYPINKTMNKYGEHNFSFDVIYELESESEALIMETKLILLSNSNNKKYGYNCNIGGEGGMRPSEETIAKMIAAQNTPELKIKKSEWLKNFHKENPNWMRERMTGNQYLKNHVWDEKYKRNMSKACKGIKPSDETRVKMSIAASGENHSQAKLTEKEVIFIRNQYKITTKNKSDFVVDLIKTYKIHKQTARDIIERRTWKHIP